MSEELEIEGDSAAIPNRIDENISAEELPPVEPPSAGFIVQLFVVPALIVGLLVGGWILVRRMVSSEQNWQSLVIELRSGNKHRRDRGAVGLAQLIRADTKMSKQGQQLSRNPQVAEELANLLKTQLKSASQNDGDLQLQTFLARTLGMLDVPRTILPVLQEAMKPDHNREVRKNAIASVAMLAGRAAETGHHLSAPNLVGDVIDFSADSDPFLRQLGAYALGLFSDDLSQQRLTVLLSDPDQKTRVNAAVGLVRQKSTAGLPVFKDVLIKGVNSIDLDNIEGETVEDRRRNLQLEEFEQFITVKNTLKAIADLSGKLSADEREEFAQLIRPISKDSRDPKIRMEALQALNQLDAAQ